MILMIDNYDSFTYNLYQSIAPLVDKVQVVRNDAITLNQITQLSPKGILLSPGPGRPEDAGMCIDIIKQFGAKIPVLGVCLGHQAIAVTFGATVSRAGMPLHGKSKLISHYDGRLFQKVPLPFAAGCYNSLSVNVDSLPDILVIEAVDADGQIMALRHRDFPIYGVQFHPESILTPDGIPILKNFIDLCC